MKDFFGTLVALSRHIGKSARTAVEPGRTRKGRIAALRTECTRVTFSSLCHVGRHRLRSASTAVPSFTALSVGHRVSVSETVPPWRATLTSCDVRLEWVGVESSGWTWELVRSSCAVRTVVPSVAWLVNEISRVAQAVVPCTLQQ